MGYDVGGYDVEPYDLETGGGTLTLMPNAYLDRPSVVWALDLYLTSSFPITFPWTFDVAPLRLSTLDLYPGGALGDVLYEGRIVQKPQVSRQSPDAFGGVEQVDAIRFDAFATPVLRYMNATTGMSTVALSAEPNLHTWVAGEHRGKICIGHLVELDRNFRMQTLQQNVFRGEISAMADDPASVSILVRAIDLASMTDLIPATLVDTGWAPYAPIGQLGKVVPFGIGIGRRIPCIPVKQQSDESTLFQFTFTANASTDALTVVSHFLTTGMGPYHVTSTGTLPGGLAVNLDYWPIVTTDDEFQLATSQANALNGVAIDLTSTGTGTHTITGGIAPNNDADYDCAVGMGNCGILRIWAGNVAQGASLDAVPELPNTYTVQHRTYRPNGRYVTSVRFPDSMDGTDITADILRVYPDVDDAVVAEWKWLTGFDDDIGGHDAYDLNVLTPGFGYDPITTAALTQTHQRYGLGGVRMTNNMFLATKTGVFPSTGNWTFELECIPSVMSTSVRTIAQGAHSGGLQVWQLDYLASTGQMRLTVYFQDGTSWAGSSTAGTAPKGVPVRVVIVRDGTTSTLYVNRTLAATFTYAGAIMNVLPGAYPLIVGIEGILGWMRHSNVARQQSYIDAAYYLWRRNGIQFIRELIGDAHRLVDTANFASAAAAWDAVNAGTLRCDGYCLGENELRAVLAALAPFRDLTFDVGTNLLLQVALAQPPTTALGSFGHGDAYGNLLAMPKRTRASLTDVPREVSVRFRRPRLGSGAFGGYEREIVRLASGIGNPAQPLELPFVDDPVTADTIADFRAKRLQRRDTVYELELGHEARTLTTGGTIVLNVPAMGVTDLAVEAISVAKGAERVSARCVPSSSLDFTYTPSPMLPADPADRTLQITDLGNNPVLSATLANARVTLAVVLADTQVLRPIADGITQWRTLVGATAHWQALDEAVADDNTSYVAESSSNFEFEGMFLAPLAAGLGSITNVVFTARLYQNSIVGDLYMTMYGGTPTGPKWMKISELFPPNDTTYRDYAITFPNNPFPYANHAPWQPSDFANLGIGVDLYYGGSCRLTQLYATVTREHIAPLAGGSCEYFRIGPSPTTPPAPADSDSPTFVAADFAPQILDQTGTSGDKYWFWARVRDEFGRTIALFGPQSVTIP